MDGEDSAASSMPNKRPCCYSSASLPPPPRPPSDLNVPSHLCNLLRASPLCSFDVSFENLLESEPSDSDKDLLIDRAISLASALVEAANRCARKRASEHNALVWFLPPELTIKVLAMLDTQSLCCASATCTMLHKWALDPLSYVDIDLRTHVPKVNDAVVSTMIQRAGKDLESLKLGIIPRHNTSVGSSQQLVSTVQNAVHASSFSWNDKRSRQGKEAAAILTRSCLNCLYSNSSVAGSLLRRLHLHNIDRMDTPALCAALSVCQSLLDLELVGLHVELRLVLCLVTAKCNMLERLFFELSKTDRDNSLKTSTCVAFVNSCPNLTYLALRGFKLHDHKVGILVKGFRKLKHVDFSTSDSITGAFLRNLGINGSVMEVLILRDCRHLKEIEIGQFLASILAGGFKFLRHIDISNKKGLASESYWHKSFYSPSGIPLKQLSEERPNICLLAEFPWAGSLLDMESTSESDADTDSSLSSQSDLSSSRSSDSSYSSSSD